MEHLTLIIVSLLVLGVDLAARRIRDSAITLPMIFVLVGMIIGPPGLGLLQPDFSENMVELLLEITLVMVLFTDGFLIRSQKLLQKSSVAGRLLGFGMIWSIAIGSIIGYWILPHLGFWQCTLLAAVLTPTDAALGQAVLTNPKVPAIIQRNLRLESGLNDGLIVPVILFLTVCESLAAGRTYWDFWIIFGSKQVGFGVLVGTLVGYGGWKLLDFAAANKTSTQLADHLSGIALALLAYSGAQWLEGNGFIATFLAGITLGNRVTGHLKRVHEFAEAQAQLLSLVTFTLFGAILIVPAWQASTWAMVLYAGLSLTGIRMAAVWVSLLGTSLLPLQRLFIGWMGPRGIASLLFALLVLRALNITHREEIFHIVALTVMGSIFLHGLTAAPLTQIFRAEGGPPDTP